MADENEKRHGEVAEESASKPRLGQLASERSAFDTGRRDRVLAGALGEPPGLVAWRGTGALVGGSVGASEESAFVPLAEDFRAQLAPDASMQVLVGETSVLDALVASVAAVTRRPLTSDQVAELSQASG